MKTKKQKKTSLGPSQPPQLAHLTIPNLITYKRQPPAMSSSVAPSCPSSQPPPDMRCHQQDQTVGWTWLLAPNLHLLLPGSSSRSPPRRPRAATAGSPPHRRHPSLSCFCHRHRRLTTDFKATGRLTSAGRFTT
jgi:hypothetical protein